MAGLPGSPASRLPAGDDEIPRQIRDLTRLMTELGPSVARSVSGIVADIKAQVADLAVVVADIAAVVTYQQGLISRDAAIGAFNTGPLVNDSTYRYVGSQAVITSMPIPTGKVRITISSSEVSISPGTNAVIGAVSYAIDGVSALDGSRYARLYVVGQSMGVSVVRHGTETLPPGTYTIRAQAYYWSAGTSAASINFGGVRVLAEVINGD